MSVSLHPHRDAFPRRRISCRRLVILGLIAGALLTSVSCTGRIGRPSASFGRGDVPYGAEFPIPRSDLLGPYRPRPLDLPKLWELPRPLELPKLLEIAPLKALELDPAQVPPGVEFQRQEPGQWAPRTDIEKVTLNWPRGQLDRIRRALESTRDG
jgi:hypothetical protein